MYLADDDQLHLTNLQRQILYRTADLDQPKARVAKRELLRLNPLCEIVALTERLSGNALQNVVADVDLVLDCSDNMETRHAINQACVAAGRTLISGSAVGIGGQLLVIEAPYAYGCYACLYPDQEIAQRNCRTSGVLGPVVGTIGTLQALEALKILAGLSSTLSGKLRLFDGKTQNWRSLQLTRSSSCAVCGGNQ